MSSKCAYCRTRDAAFYCTGCNATKYCSDDCADADFTVGAHATHCEAIGKLVTLAKEGDAEKYDKQQEQTTLEQLIGWFDPNEKDDNHITFRTNFFAAVGIALFGKIEETMTLFNALNVQIIEEIKAWAKRNTFETEQNNDGVWQLYNPADEEKAGDTGKSERFDMILKWRLDMQTKEQYSLTEDELNTLVLYQTACATILYEAYARILELGLLNTDTNDDEANKILLSARRVKLLADAFGQPSIADMGTARNVGYGEVPVIPDEKYAMPIVDAEAGEADSTDKAAKKDDKEKEEEVEPDYVPDDDEDSDDVLPYRVVPRQYLADLGRIIPDAIKNNDDAVRTMAENVYLTSDPNRPSGKKTRVVTDRNFETPGTINMTNRGTLASAVRYIIDRYRRANYIITKKPKTDMEHIEFIMTHLGFLSAPQRRDLSKDHMINPDVDILIMTAMQEKFPYVRPGDVEEKVYLYPEEYSVTLVEFFEKISTVVEHRLDNPFESMSDKDKRFALDTLVEYFLFTGLDESVYEMNPVFVSEYYAAYFKDSIETAETFRKRYADEQQKRTTPAPLQGGSGGKKARLTEQLIGNDENPTSSSSKRRTRSSDVGLSWYARARPGETSDRPSRLDGDIHEKRIGMLTGIWNALRDFNSEFIGLVDVKKGLASRILNFIANPGKFNTGNFNIVMWGNPGTGKTRVAQTIASLYYKLGFILVAPPDTGAPIKTRADFVAPFLGRSTLKTRNTLARSFGSMMIIDEAYAIMAKSDDQFGSEALDMITSLMEQYQRYINIVITGYKGQLQKQFFARAPEGEPDAEVWGNPGLFRRFGTKLSFENYSALELLLIVYTKTNGRALLNPEILAYFYDDFAMLHDYEVPDDRKGESGPVFSNVNAAAAEQIVSFAIDYVNTNSRSARWLRDPGSQEGFIPPPPMRGIVPTLYHKAISYALVKFANAQFPEPKFGEIELDEQYLILDTLKDNVESQVSIKEDGWKQHVLETDRSRIHREATNSGYIKGTAIKEGGDAVTVKELGAFLGNL